jgi:hypothetical protein
LDSSEAIGEGERLPIKSGALGQEAAMRTWETLDAERETEQQSYNGSGAKLHGTTIEKSNDQDSWFPGQPGRVAMECPYMPVSRG